MALTAALTRTTVSQDGTTSTWTDETVYGTANPDRNEVAVYLTAYKVDVGQVETALTVTTFDPETATTFTTDNGDEDGWVKYYFVIVDNWLIGTQYEEFDLVWSTTQNAFYEYTNSTPSTGNAVTDTSFWEVVPDPTTKIANVGTDEESGNLIYQVVDKVLSYQTSICYIKAASINAKENCSGETCGCDTKIGRAYHKIRDLFANLPLNEATGEYLEGEKNARLAEKYCVDCGCLDR